MRVWSDGRVTIPKRVRDEYGFLPGRNVRMQTVSYGVIRMWLPDHPESRSLFMVKKGSRRYAKAIVPDPDSFPEP
ncbi:MAG TPA: hypothetical protein VFB16_00330 [Bauldia sp.]|nr:hypothetical protein [Bauldia sp.]